MGHSVFLLCASLAPYTKLVYSRGQHLQIEFCQLGPLCIKKGLGEVTELSKRADGKSHCKGGISIFWVLPWCFFVCFFLGFFGFFATTKEIVLTGSAHFWKVVQLFGD